MSFVRPKEIQCIDWEPKDPTKPGEKRCRYYDPPTVELDRGFCFLPTRFGCEEWDRANAHRGGLVGPPDPQKAGESTQLVPEPPQRSLGIVAGGDPEDPARARQKTAKQRRLPLAALPEDPGPDVLVSLTEAQVESLEKTGLEVRLRSDDPLLGDIWLVPEITGNKDRTELRFRDASVLRMIVDVFPGARVLTIRRADMDE